MTTPSRRPTKPMRTKGQCALLGRDEHLSREDVEAIIAAREARGRNAKQKGAKQLLEVLTRPQSDMSKKYIFNMFGDEDEADDDRPPAA
jgi:hypothetical protein